MSSKTFRRKAGANGANGVGSGGSGQAGQAGGRASVTNTDPDAVDTATSVGGAGGNGGNGAYGSGHDDGGNSGAGGVGGAAYATVRRLKSFAGATSATASATGGRGGTAGSFGYSQSGYPGHGADGGRGAGAAAYASSRSGHTTTATAKGYGGAGGDGVGIGYSGGAGGRATARAVATTGSGDATATAQAVGGKGGAGLLGADGGVGGSANLTSTSAKRYVDGVAKGADLHLDQFAIGGAGGASYGGEAGAGGTATSVLIYADRDKRNKAIYADPAAIGGRGGDGRSDIHGTSDGAAGGVATSTANVTGAILHVNSLADGGYGGDAGDGSNGGAGGAAASSAESHSSPVEGATSRSVAVGGNGGKAGSNGNGGNGGRANASDSGSNGASANSVQFSAAFFAEADGGDGGDGDGSGHRGGNGGYATAAASGVSGGTAPSLRIEATANGGKGGDGTNGANGGAGGAASLRNAASGEVSKGLLYLTETATGGRGGSSDGGLGGVGGAGTAILTYEDQGQNDRPVSVTATASAVGGSSTRTGGTTYASAKVDTVGRALSNTTAYAGYGGEQSGAARSRSEAIGAQANSFAYSGMLTDSNTGNLASTSIATGKSGSFDARCYHGLVFNGLYSCLAKASGTLKEQSTGQAVAKIATQSPLAALDTTDQSVAIAAALPLRADVDRVLNANARIKTAFTGSNDPTYYAVGELGGSHNAGGSAYNTTSASLDFRLYGPNVPDAQDLVLGLYNGTAVGAGFSRLSFDAQAVYTAQDGTTQTVELLKGGHRAIFTSVAAAKSYFTNHAIDLGDVATLSKGAGFDLVLTMIETTRKGSGFYGNLILGNGTLQSNPSAAPSATSDPHRDLAAALFDGAFGHDGVDTAPTGAATGHGVAESLFAACFDHAAR